MPKRCSDHTHTGCWLAQATPDLSLIQTELFNQEYIRTHIRSFSFRPNTECVYAA